MPEPMIKSFRTANTMELAAAIQDARSTTLALFECFAAAGLDNPAKVPILAILNPPLWELGHLAWFAEWYILREAQTSNPTSAIRTSMLTKGDDWFDSNTVHHRQRWNLGLPNTGSVKTYCREVHDRVLDKLSRTPTSDAALYFYRLLLAHEDKHAEALACSLQTLRIAPPASLITQSLSAHSLVSQTLAAYQEKEIRFPAATMTVGGDVDAPGFQFDNEKWAHSVAIPAFSIDTALVSNAQYSQFINDGGYQNPTFWTNAGRRWLMKQSCSAPRGWTRDAGHWVCERFGRYVSLASNEPVRHVTLFEAQAYCVWAQRHLPTEAQWQRAASSGHPAFRWGDLWEWTDSVFAAYPGFKADAYQEYSAPWFGTHQTVRGASFATPSRMRSHQYRNFYEPHRSDMFIGFRTCVN
jgi:iron(II)-dependent oxidoreductase